MFSKKTKKEVVPEEEIVVAEEPIIKKKSHKEHVFGAFLLGGLIVVVILGLAGAGFGTYSLWKQQSAESQSPSISGLPVAEAMPEEQAEVTEGASETTKEAEKNTVTDEVLKKAQTLDIIVMNGGGAKGVASTTAETLKSKGFTKVTIGNTKGDFTGTTVYAKKANQESAEAVVSVLKSAYPSIVYKEALASDPETTTATVTIIFGKE
jgi:LytR cell envelope-related transcriptional attenuator